MKNRTSKHVIEGRVARKAARSEMTIREMEFIAQTIERLVRGTGYPVTAQVLKSINVNREQLRHMERKGLVKSLELHCRGQMTKAYYTESIWPSKIPVREPEVTEVQEG